MRWPEVPSNLTVDQLADKESKKYVADVNGKLIAGHEVTLIGMNGLPKYIKSIFGNHSHGPSILGDGTFSIEGVGAGIIELFPSIPIEKYSISFEIRQIRSQGQNALGLSPENSFGFYFNKFYKVDDKQDIPAIDLINIKERTQQEMGNEKGAVSFQQISFLRAPSGAPSKQSKVFSLEHLERTTTIPGPWRSFSVAVKPENVTISRKNASDDLYNVLMKVDFLHSSRSTKLTILKNTIQNEIYISPYPKMIWPSERSIGIWNHATGMSIRNLTITPLHAQE